MADHPAVKAAGSSVCAEMGFGPETWRSWPEVIRKALIAAAATLPADLAEAVRAHWETTT